MAQTLRAIKCVVIGDGAVGKTSTLISVTTGTFPQDYIPTVFDNYSVALNYDDCGPVSLGLWDTAGPEDYDRLRPLSYPQTDVFLLVFSRGSHTSYENIRSKWTPEIQHHCPSARRILYANKSDLVENPDFLATLKERGLRHVTSEEGFHMAAEIGASYYIEGSALTGSNLSALLRQIIRTAVLPNQEKGPGILRSSPTPPRKPPAPKPPYFVGPSAREIFYQVRQEIKAAFASKRFTDVNIVAEGQTIPAHKIILACGSTLFYRALTQGEISPVFQKIEPSNVLELTKPASEKGKKSKKQSKQTSTAILFRISKQICPEESMGRYGMTAFQHDGILYTVGGADKTGKYCFDMLRWDLKKSTFLSPVACNEGEWPRGNLHSQVQLKNSDVLVYGGKSNGYSNKMWLFKVDDSKWSEVKYTGTGPGSVYGHSATLVGDYMYVFGGYDNVCGLNNDFHRYNITNNTWEAMTTQPRPCPRYGHYQASFGNASSPKIVLFGGRGSEKDVYNDIWIYDIKKDSWRQSSVSGGPAGRYGCAAFVENNVLFVFGGFDGTLVHNDMWALKLNSSTLQWTTVQSPGGEAQYSLNHSTSEFLGRYHHAIVQTSAGFWIIGGRNEDHTLSLFWEEGGGRVEQDKDTYEIISPTTIHLSVPFSQAQAWIQQIYDGPGKVRPVISFGEQVRTDEGFQRTLQELALSRKSPCPWTDFVFKTSDNKTVGGYKVLSQANSGLFKAMFDTFEDADMATTDIELPLKLTSQQFQVVREFISGSPIILTKSHVLETLVIANQHMLDALEKQCIAFIIQIVHKLDPFEVLKVARSAHSEILVSAAICFLQTNFDGYQTKLHLLEEADRTRVIQGQWPGVEYHKAYAIYQEKYDQWKQQHGSFALGEQVVYNSKQKSSENCVLQ